MSKFIYFKNSSKSGNNFFRSMFILTLAIYLGVLITPSKCHAKTSELFEKEDKNNQTEPSIPTFPQANFNQSLENNKKKEPLENNDKGTPTNQNSTDPTAKSNILLKQLRDRVRRDLLASGTNDPTLVERTLDSLPINEVDEPAAFFNGQKLKAGTIGSLGISQNSLARAYRGYIEPILKVELGFEIDEISGGYGGGNLYKAYDPKGVEFYMSLVGFGSFKSQTFVVLWEKDPRVP